MKQQAIGADGLVAVMLQGHGLARKRGEKEREQNRAREMDHVCVADQAPKCEHAGVSHHGKGQRSVVEISRRGFRSYGEIKQRPVVYGAKVREAAGEGQHDGLHAANVGCKRMGVQEQLHSESLWAAPRVESVAAAGSAPVSNDRVSEARGRTLATPRAMASTAAS